MLCPPLGSCFKDPKPSLRFGAFFCLPDSRIFETELGILHACHLSSFYGKKEGASSSNSEKICLPIRGSGDRLRRQQMSFGPTSVWHKKEKRKRETPICKTSNQYTRKRWPGGCLYYNWGKAVFCDLPKAKLDFIRENSSCGWQLSFLLPTKKRVEKRDPDKKGYYYFYLHLTIPRKIGECVTKAFVEIKLLFLGKRQRDRLRALLAPRNFPFSRRDK